MICLPDTSRETVAIVGSGISGLVCAHRLRRDYDVTIFEANDWIGGHTHTVDVRLDGANYTVDTGFIVFNPLNYPGFTALLDELGVSSQPTTMSFSVRCDRTGLEYNGTSVNRLFAQRRNVLRPRFLGMVRDIVRFGREARAVLEDTDDEETVGAYAARRGYGAAFVDHYLVPIGSSIWSCSAAQFRDFPVRFVVEFLANHRMLDVGGRPEWRVVRGGSRRYVEALVAPFVERIRLRTPVLAARRRPDGVDVVTSPEGTRSFDHVIFACHSDQALEILRDASPVERELLRAFPYQRYEAVLHTDTSVLPRRLLAWAAWNHRVRACERDAVAVTYNMNILQGIRAKHTFCVTLNGEDDIDPGSVIDRFVYHHPVAEVGRAAAQRRHAEVIDVNRTSFCGAYWGYGFHEDGVRSALAVTAALERRARKATTT